MKKKKSYFVLGLISCIVIAWTVWTQFGQIDDFGNRNIQVSAKEYAVKTGVLQRKITTSPFVGFKEDPTATPAAQKIPLQATPLPPASQAAVNLYSADPKIRATAFTSFVAVAKTDRKHITNQVAQDVTCMDIKLAYLQLESLAVRDANSLMNVPLINEVILGLIPFLANPSTEADALTALNHYSFYLYDDHPASWWRTGYIQSKLYADSKPYKIK